MMLLYHPALDPYHAGFRTTRLLSAVPQSSMEPLRLRILDFYLLFPSFLRGFAFPRSLTKWRSRFNFPSNDYFVPSDANPRLIFRQMAGPHQGALSEFVSKGITILDDNGTLSIREDRVPAPLLGAARESNAREQLLVDFLTKELASVPVGGGGGLKARSGLVDARYDEV
jgi:ABC-three component (ABC-3C) system Middle Component 5